MIIHKDSKNRHLEFTRILCVPGIWAGVAISPQGVVLGLWKYFISISHVKKPWVGVWSSYDEWKFSNRICRCLERAAIRVGVAVSPQGVVVGFWKCFQSIYRVEKPWQWQKSRENRLVWAFYRCIPELFSRSDGRGHSVRSPKYFFYLLRFFRYLDPIEALYEIIDFYNHLQVFLTNWPD